MNNHFCFANLNDRNTMPTLTNTAKAALRDFNFKQLFNELGWDNFDASHRISLDSEVFPVRAIAQKRGVQIFTLATRRIPDYQKRRKLHLELRNLALEHLIVFYDEQQTTQVWLWGNRDNGKTFVREHRFDQTQSGDALFQKLDRIAFTLSEEEALDITTVAFRLKDALDREKIETTDSLSFLHALYFKTLKDLKILDPTVGSGAFLFAALKLLLPLYAETLDRLRTAASELDFPSLSPDRKKLVSDVQNELAAVAHHKSEAYFILKTIILNNLYGVDIVEEAVEICKLRLFLKLVATIDERDALEPLPDIKAFAENLQSFRANQLLAQTASAEPTNLANDKESLLKQEKTLIARANRYVKIRNAFHWLIEFNAILESGGFDVVIGNPPYLEFKEVDYNLEGFTCSETKAVHAVCMERALELIQPKGCMSMIVPLSLVSTQRMKIVQELLENKRNAWYSNFSWRPAKLFDTVNRALTIFVVTPSNKPATYSTNYQKWTSDEREGLMKRVSYVQTPRKRDAFWIPKLGSELELSILNKCLAVPTKLGFFASNNTSYKVFYRTDGGLYWKVFTNFPPKFYVNKKAGSSSRETTLSLKKKEFVIPAIGALSSNVFWWWYTITSNMRHLNPYDIHNFPFPESVLSDKKLIKLGREYLDDIEKNSEMLVREQKQTGRTETQSFKIQKSKPIIDDIDRVLAAHYGFTEEELDFIINYDIKYRMGKSAAAEEE